MKIRRLHEVSFQELQEIAPALADPLHSNIEMGNWEMGQNTLMTRGASSCIIVAAHNESEKIGLLGHFTNISGEHDHNDREAFKSALSGIEHIGPSEATEIWVGGAAEHVRDGDDVVDPDREFALSSLRSTLAQLGMDYDVVSVDWSQPKMVVDASLDCQAGVLAVHAQSEDYLFKF